MAQIVKSETGHWVGKEIYKGEQYFGYYSQFRYRHPADKMLIVDFDELQADIYKYLKISIFPQTTKSLVKRLAIDLCSERHGVIYALDYKADFGVRKIVDFEAQIYV